MILRRKFFAKLKNRRLKDQPKIAPFQQLHENTHEMRPKIKNGNRNRVTVESERYEIIIRIVIS